MSIHKEFRGTSLAVIPALGLLASAAGPTAVAQVPPAEAFAALPAMQSPSLSADGTRLAFISHAQAGSFILVTDLENMAVTAGVDSGESKPRSVFWVDDDALVYTAGVTTNPSFIPGQVESMAPYGVDLGAEAGQATVTRLLQGNNLPGAGRIGGMFAIDGAQLIGFQRSTGQVLYPKFDTDRAERVLYAVDPRTDRQTVVDRAARSTRDWVVDEDGEPLFRADYVERSNQFHLLGRVKSRWEPLISDTVDIPELAMYGLDEDGSLVIGTRAGDAETFGLYLLSTETGEVGAPVLTHDRYDVGGVRIDPYTNRVVGAALSDATPIWFDDGLREHQTLLTEAFPGESPVIVSWSEDRNRLIVVTEGPNRAPGVYLYDAREANVAQIASVFTALQGVALPERREYSYTARDGTTIPGYLTRPLDADGPTPAVVLPHGGPAARDVGGFDWMAHFLASRGYTVLQPNFRGSGGLGRAWQEAGHGEWGIGVMQHDLSDGLAALVEEGLVDAERVCIVGASYGGYAALAGAVFTPELYRCAAAVAPVTDLVDMLSFERGRRGGLSAAVSYWRQAMGGGNPDGLNDRLRAASPAAHAERAQAPILLVHGRDDTVVPIEQSRTMLGALESAGKTVELIELDGEDHWLSIEPTRVATLQALERFLAEHLGERAPAGASATP